MVNSESLIWKSFEVTEREKFERVRRGTGKANFYAKASPFPPRTFPQYVSHRIEYLEDRIAALNGAILRKKEASKSHGEIMPAFGGKKVDMTSWLGFRPLEIPSYPVDGDEEFCDRSEQLLGSNLFKEIDFYITLLKSYI